MTDRRDRRKLDAVYASMPSIECQGKCAESCGPIAMGRVEWERICERVGHVPEGTPDLTCPLLVDDRCSVYDIRPVICRLWGMVEAMPCQWGCKPTRMLTDTEAYRLLETAGQVGEP